MFVVLFLVMYLVFGVVGFIGWFRLKEESRTFTGLVSCWCCGFTFAVCGVLLYLIWFEGLTL